jgi:hypothetical protein
MVASKVPPISAVKAGFPGFQPSEGSAYSGLGACRLGDAQASVVGPHTATTIGTK